MCKHNDGHVICPGGRIVAEHWLDPGAADGSLVVRIGHRVDVEKCIDEGRILNDMRSSQDAISGNDGAAAEEAVVGRWTIGRNGEQTARVQRIDGRFRGAGDEWLNMTFRSL